MNSEQLLQKSAQHVQDALSAKNLDLNVVVLDDSARTAQAAADALGCQVAQILKSLVFKTKQSNKPILVLASGSNRVDEKLIATYVGEKITKPDAAFVREATGYAIGGIPPVGHVNDLETYIDEDLFQYNELWAAAGTPHAVFKLTPDNLKDLCHGKVVRVK